MAKNLGRLILYGVSIFSRALSQAIRNQPSAFDNGNNHVGGGGISNKVSSDILSGMTLEESKQILNLKSFDPKEVERNYQYLFNANDKRNGGSFYIQSKVFRAKERIDLQSPT
ncbi:Mitochondrial import inner membrane translocase subunit TIM16 [Oopsacas minuta]|uniref:Mitochondrial import inner membrane translocase subunit TIM16 n=1 Tax=Oopsacas minuta TaxID=111878 RepID=A0AAV7JD13_9METZ|nr:Mitochondrial import inner membrane translocase subunit TIM16 [Oopsacas minuta]